MPERIVQSWIKPCPTPAAQRFTDLLNDEAPYLGCPAKFVARENILNDEPWMIRGWFGEEGEPKFAFYRYSLNRDVDPNDVRVVSALVDDFQKRYEREVLLCATGQGAEA